MSVLLECKGQSVDASGLHRASLQQNQADDQNQQFFIVLVFFRHGPLVCVFFFKYLSGDDVSRNQW